MINYSSPLSALTSFGTVVQVSAHNIANINTEGFQARNVVLQSGPSQDQGVQVANIYKDTAPGPAIIRYLHENAGEVEPLPPSGAPQAHAFIEGSNTELPREFTKLMTTQAAHGAVAATIRAWDELTGSILNVRA